jgi:hypothetical protein
LRKRILPLGPRVGGIVALLLASASADAQSGAGGVTLRSGREIADRHIEAIGGREALMKLESREVWASFEIPGERVRGTIEIFTARPNRRVLRVTPTDGGTDVTGFDGVTGWRKDAGRSPVAIRGRELTQLRDDSAFDLDLRDPRDFTLLQNIGIVRWEGRECHKVRVVSATGREWIDYFDVATGLYAGSESRRETDKGQVTLKTVVSAYKSYDGVRLPSIVSLRSGGVEQIIKLIRVRHNRVSAAVFAPPRGLATGGTK